MRILAQLYDCVENNLGTGQTVDWPGFAAGFRQIAGCHMALYRATFENGPVAPTDVHIIATSSRPVMEAYINERHFENHPVSEKALAPLEPSRRTDLVPNEAFRQLGAIYDFLSSHGIFYIMVVPAAMSDGSYLGLYVWRGEHEEDFSDLEKQRLALIMRHLLVVVDDQDVLPGEPGDDVLAFGEEFGLTPTEMEMLSALLKGETLRSIARDTGRTYGTVRWHVQNLLRKCQVTSQRNLLNAFYTLIAR